MVKLKHLRAYKMEEVSEEIRDEVFNTSRAMLMAISPVIEGKDANVILGALNYVQAAMINTFVSDDPKEKAKAAAAFAVDLMRNVEKASGVDVFAYLKSIDLEDPNQSPQSS